MLGTYRLLLAILVALSHANVRIAGLNPGVIAVVCFYLISGYVMTGLLRSHFSTKSKIPAFYVDRVMRLFPQYLTIAAITLSWFYFSGEHTAFLQRSPTLSDILANLSVVPLNYYMFNGSDQFTLLPPAWSLGAEIQFYLLMPFLLWWRTRLPAFLIALAVFFAATWGILNTDFFGYRLLPGVLVFFLIGSALYDVSAKNTQAWHLPALVALGVGAVTLILLQGGHLLLPYNKETLFGLLVGVPLLGFLARLPQHWLDNRLGDLSYGVFLNHFLLQWGVFGVPSGAMQLSAYILLSVALSYLTQKMVEQPVLRWRKKIRN